MAIQTSYTQARADVAKLLLAIFLCSRPLCGILFEGSASLNPSNILPRESGREG